MWADVAAIQESFQNQQSTYCYQVPRLNDN